MQKGDNFSTFPVAGCPVRDVMRYLKLHEYVRSRSLDWQNYTAYINFAKSAKGTHQQKTMVAIYCFRSVELLFNIQRSEQDLSPLKLFFFFKVIRAQLCLLQATLKRICPLLHVKQLKQPQTRSKARPWFILRPRTFVKHQDDLNHPSAETDLHNNSNKIHSYFLEIVTHQS